MTALDNKWCTCYGRSIKKGKITPEELGRYGKGLMHILADKIANPTPSSIDYQNQPSRHRLLDLGEWSERKSEAMDTNGTPHVSIEMVRLGFKMRPMRDGAGKRSPGTLAPSLRTKNPLNDKGEQIVKYCVDWGHHVDLKTTGKYILSQIGSLKTSRTSSLRTVRLTAQ